MKIISWNVNGIRAVHRKGLFVPFVEKYRPDIICLQETKAKQDQSELDLKEYQEYWNSADKAGYSGVAIFTKEKPISVINGLGDDICEKHKLKEDAYGDPNKEGRILTAEFKDFYVISVYTPNSKGDLSRLSLRHKQWDPAFLEYIIRLRSGQVNGKKKHVIFCGDLNVAHKEIDLANPKENEGEHGFTKEEREGMDKIVEAGFIDTFREFNKQPQQYTWWTPWRNARGRNIGWRIDYFVANKEFLPKIKHSEILSEVLGSDHCPILLTFEP